MSQRIGVCRVLLRSRYPTLWRYVDPLLGFLMSWWFKALNIAFCLTTRKQNFNTSKIVKVSNLSNHCLTKYLRVDHAVLKCKYTITQLFQSRCQNERCTNKSQATRNLLVSVKVLKTQPVLLATHLSDYNFADINVWYTVLRLHQTTELQMLINTSSTPSHQIHSWFNIILSHVNRCFN